MLSFACGSVYDMIGLEFFKEAETFTEKGTLLPHPQSPSQHIAVGTVISRLGPSGSPYFLQSALGMLHFGIITKEVLPSIDAQEHFEDSQVARMYFGEDKRWARGFFLKRQYFDRYQIQHYVKHGRARVKETSLGEFLFGEEKWMQSTWFNSKFPPSWKITIPTETVEQLQKKLRKLQETLGEEKYSLFSRNCESYCMEIAYDKEGTFNITSVQIAFVVLVVVLLFVIIVLSIFFARKKRRQMNTK